MSDRFYITTPIYYVNGTPHIGHAYTTIAADVATRYNRVLGRESFLLTGTDEHGQKVLQAAEKRGMTPKEHCDDIVGVWRTMMSGLGVEYDRFIRTTDADHERVVQDALQLLRDHDLVYRAEYEGWYYVPDEIFVTEKDVEEGRYDRDKLTRLTEVNWFFRMGRYQERLIAHIEANPGFLRPSSRKNEVLGFLRKPLEDLCISRPRARMSWGIPLPFDGEFVTYVWFDALLNYLTGAGWHPTEPKPGWDRRWPPTFQLLGKDILTTHAVYWSTMLMALHDVCAPGAKPALPDALFAHGWWTTDGQKMSKSLGNTIDVGMLVESFGVDATRYFFLREIPFGQDGAFSYDGFLLRYNVDLANDFGNLAHRGLSMTTMWLGGRVPAWSQRGPAEDELAARAQATFEKWRTSMDNLLFHDAMAAVVDLISAGNKYVDTEQPWTLNKNGDVARLRVVKRAVLETVWLATALLMPVMPGKCAELAEKLGKSPAAAAELVRGLAAGRPVLCDLDDDAPITLGDPLFPRHREMPEPLAGMLAAAKAEPPPVEKPSKKPKKNPETEKTMSETPETPAAPAAEAPATPATITYDDFAKIKLRTGKVVASEKHPKADKLLVLKVDVGDPEPRTIVAGIASKFAPEDLVGRTVVVVVNLAPAKLRGIVSEGMLLAAGGDKGVIELATVPDCAPGEVVR